MRAIFPKEANLFPSFGGRASFGKLHLWRFLRKDATGREYMEYLRYSKEAHPWWWSKITIQEVARGRGLALPIPTTGNHSLSVTLRPPLSLFKTYVLRGTKGNGVRLRVEGDQRSPSSTMMVSTPWPYAARSFGMQSVDLLSKGWRSTSPEVNPLPLSEGSELVSVLRKASPLAAW